MSDEIDPKGLVREAYRIDGISLGECRSIFLDWALALPVDADTAALIATLIARHGTEDDETPAHPMTRVLREGLEGMGRPRRRGGASSRPTFHILCPSVKLSGPDGAQVHPAHDVKRCVIIQLRLGNSRGSRSSANCERLGSFYLTEH